MVLAAPDPCAERLADSKANTHGDSDDQEADEDLDYDSIALAEVCEAVTAVSAHLCVLGLASPVLLAWPNVAVGASLCAFRRLAHAVLACGDDCLDVGVEGVRM